MIFRYSETRYALFTVASFKIDRHSGDNKIFCGNLQANFDIWIANNAHAGSTCLEWHSVIIAPKVIRLREDWNVKFAARLANWLERKKSNEKQIRKLRLSFWSGNDYIWFRLANENCWRFFWYTLQEACELLFLWQFQLKINQECGKFRTNWSYMRSTMI